MNQLVFETVPFTQVRPEIKVPCAGDDDGRVIVFNGDAHITHDLFLDYEDGFFAGSDSGESPINGIIVRGNLTIDGALLNFEDDYGPFLIVSGNLTARAVATGGATLHVAGDLIAPEIIGVYNHGYTQVDGAVIARAVVSEHTFITKEFRTEWTWDRGGANDTANAARNMRYLANGVLAAGLANTDGFPDLEKARQRIAKGKPILKPAFTSILDKVVAGLAKKLENPDTVKKISLQFKDLPAIPEEIFRFRNLEVLDLTHNKIRKLPEEICLLTELRQLILVGNLIVELPESIGKLTKLQLLDLKSNCIAHIPDSIANCRELTTIDLTNNPQAYIHKAFASWENTKYIETIPDAIARLPKLETLVIDSTFIRNLPSVPFASDALQMISAVRCMVREIPPALSGILETDPQKNADRATGYIRFWFDPEKLPLRTLYDEKKGTCHFGQAIAVVKHILHFNIPLLANEDDILKNFEKQINEFQKRFEWSGWEQQAKKFFATLSDSMDAFGETYPDTLLIGKLKELFAKYA